MPHSFQHRLRPLQLLGLVLLVAGLMACTAGQGRLYPQNATPTPLGVISDTPVEVTFEELNAEPLKYLNKLVRVSGVYTQIPVVACTQQKGPSTNWRLISDELYMDAIGFDRVLALAPEGTPFTIDGVFQRYIGPLGCGKSAPRGTLYFLNALAIVEPNPLPDFAFVAAQPPDGTPSSQIEPTPNLTLTPIGSPTPFEAVTPTPSPTLLTTFTPTATLDETSEGDYEAGYEAGFAAGSSTGYSDAINFLDFGENYDDSTPIDSPSIDFSDGFVEGYADGYQQGYARGELDRDDPNFTPPPTGPATGTPTPGGTPGSGGTPTVTPTPGGLATGEAGTPDAIPTGSVTPGSYPAPGQTSTSTPTPNPYP